MPETYRISGPILTGQYRPIMQDINQEIIEEVAAEGDVIVHANLASSLRNPTGYYEGQVVVEAGQEEVSITDNGVVYGPWLEGTSSRNRSTQFKGYASFRRATQELQSRVSGIAEDVLRRTVRRLG